MKLATIGVGYVGLVTAACFAELGHEVLGIDIDENKIKLLNEGEMPIYEPGLRELVLKNTNENRLKFKSKFDEEIDSVKAIFIAVGTPQGNDGKADLTYVYKAIDLILPFIKTPKIFVLKSTVPIRTNEEIKKYLEKKSSIDFSVVSNPEFLKEGTAVNDFMKPDRIVIGTESIKTGEIMKELYSVLTRNGHPIYIMDPVSAETVKYVSNAMLALKVSFINEIARLCDEIGADIRRVREGVISDPRIGNQFFYPSIGYGGSCFPKDVQALMYMVNSNSLDLLIPKATHESNEKHSSWFLNKIIGFFGKENIKNKNLAIWGTSFKAGTDDIRESPAIKIIEGLLNIGASLTLYDPIAIKNTKKYFANNSLNLKIKYATSEGDSIKGTDALVVCTEWLQFRNPDFEKVASELKDKVVFDGRNLYDPEKLKLYGLTHIGIGIRSDKNIVNVVD